MPFIVRYKSQSKGFCTEINLRKDKWWHILNVSFSVFFLSKLPHSVGQYFFLNYLALDHTSLAVKDISDQWPSMSANIGQMLSERPLSIGALVRNNGLKI